MTTAPGGRFLHWSVLAVGITLVVFCWSLFLTGCQGCNPAPTVDEAASNLDVKATVLDTTQNSSDGKVPVVAQFFLNGKMVQFGGSATVTCNGVNLTFNGLGYAERVPMVAQGGSYKIVYTRGGSSTTLTATVPQRPVVISPAANSTVTRSPSLTITYVSDGGSGMRGSAGDGSTGIGGNVQPDNGTYSGFNVSSLKAGAGTLGMTREITSTPGGTGFKSAQVSYSTGIDNKVTWN